MAKWQAIGPISVNLVDGSLSYGNITVSRYDREGFQKLLDRRDLEYWSPVYLSLSGVSSCWLKLDFRTDVDENHWTKAVNQITRFLQGLALYKSTFSLLTMSGLLVKRTDGHGQNFGWQRTIIGKRYYLLRREEYDHLNDLLIKFDRFWNDLKAKQANRQLKRIGAALQFYTQTFQTMNLVDRFIFLSIALEALYGEGHGELQYRYSNRAALLLGDEVERRKEVHTQVLRAYRKRSAILHGGTDWIVETEEALSFNEIIRQSILRCMSLYMQDYSNVGKTLDKCLHDLDREEQLLRDARSFFGSHSEYREPEESHGLRRVGIRK